MRYEILGPLQVIGRDGKALAAPRKVELLLAALLIRAGQVVPVPTLINEVWGARPPRRVNAGLQVYVSQLRKLLAAAGGPAEPIATRAAGYRLDLGPAGLDSDTFLDRFDHGRLLAEDGRHDAAVESFDRALALFRGPVLDDLRGGPLVDGFAAWATETRLQCVEARVESMLRLGRPREVIGHLYATIAEHPLRESLCRQLMVALHDCGRRAEALDAYRRTRSTLARELGVEPGPALRRLWTAMLRSDGERALAADRAVAGGR